MSSPLEARYVKWLDALESGTFKQGRGQMCRMEDSGVRYCCLGVLDKAVYGEEFTVEDGSEFWPDLPSDSGGAIMYPSVQRLMDMNLKEPLIDSELETVYKEIKDEDWDNVLEDSPTRLDILIQINDRSDSFEKVVETIRRFNWHKEGG